MGAAGGVSAGLFSPRVEPEHRFRPLPPPVAAVPPAARRCRAGAVCRCRATPLAAAPRHCLPDRRPGRRRGRTAHLHRDRVRHHGREGVDERAGVSVDRAHAAARIEDRARIARRAAACDLPGALLPVTSPAAARNLRGRRCGLPHRILTVLRHLPGGRTAEFPCRIRRLHAHLPADGRNRALHAVARSPRAGAAGAEDRESHALNARLVRGSALAVLALAAIDLAARQIVRRALLQALPGATPSIAFVVLIALAAGIAGVLAVRRRATFVVLATCFVLGLALQVQLGARLQSDGFYYYAYLRSLAFDRDVDFMNDYRLLGLGDKTYLFQPTRTGKAESAWTIGPAIVWSPFFAAGHVAALRLHAEGRDVAVDGTSFPYRQAVCIASLFYGLLGCWFAYRLTRMFCPALLAGAAVALVTTGSFMLWYLVKEPSMTHAASMAGVAGFAWLWVATRENRSLQVWALLGLVAGFIALIRWQNILFALLPGIDAVVITIAAVRTGNRQALRAAFAGGGVFLAGMVIGFLPQMLAWQSIYGSPIARSPVGPQIRWLHPQLADILWSARNGLFSTTPILYVAAVGLGVFAFLEPAAGLPMIAALAVMIYFNACIQDWWGSAGFGGRRFDGVIPFFCVGLAAFLDAAAFVVRRHAVAAGTAAGAPLALLELPLIGAGPTGGGGVGGDGAVARAGGAQAGVVHGWFGNPFTYPASLVFALRNGVSPGEYDMLRTNRFLADPLQPYGRIDIGAPDTTGAGTADEALLADGWYAPEREGAITFRWTASPATLRVPLDHAAPLRVQIRAHAFAYPGAPPQ